MTMGSFQEKEIAPAENAATWGRVHDIVVGESFDRKRPLKNFWGFRCPECSKIIIPKARWIEGTHYLIEYWGCKHCGYEYAHFRLARQLYAEYASPVYRPDEVVKTGLFSS